MCSHRLQAEVYRLPILAAGCPTLVRGQNTTENDRMGRYGMGKENRGSGRHTE